MQWANAIGLEKRGGEQRTENRQPENREQRTEKPITDATLIMTIYIVV